MPIKVPVVQTGLEQSIQQAATKVGKNLRINMGPGAKSIESLAKPLGRLTGRADEFTKSMEAANARVLAFGASVGVIAAVSNGLKELVSTTIQVEKSLANINSILKQSESQLNSFKNQIFDIARNTGQTFDTVAEAALELSRQGLKAEEVTKRLNDALVLSRLSGLSAADSVAGLTAAVNSFSSAGLTTTDVLNKISAAAASAAVSDRDLIEGLKRSGSVAVAAGVQFDELVGIISALQERTSRGGAVIGNSLKTIFTRIQDVEKLKSLQNLGVQVTDLEGRVLSSNKVIENLAPTFAKLDQATKVNLADNLVGKFQIAPFLALLEDYNLKVSRSGEVATTSFNATNEAYQRNEVLAQTLSATINTATVSLKELANALGEIGVTDSLKNIIGIFNSVVSNITDILDGDGIGSKFAKGLIKGISSIVSGPGLALALVAIGKLLLDFAKFGAGALKTFFGLNKAAEAQANLQGQIAASLLNDKGIRSAILSIEKQNISEGEKKKLQTAFFTKALNEQLAVMQRMQGIARTIAPGVMAGTASRRGRRAAGGFLPIGAESSDISRGVGGAPASAKPVVIPNFAFGGGKRGTMVANDSEYIVPNYANGGDAIFNQNMVSSMGLPANARKVRAAGGFIPNFAQTALGLFRKTYSLDRIRSEDRSVFFNTDGSPATGRVRDVLKKHPESAEAKALLAKRGRIYDANRPVKSVMLVPQESVFNASGANHRFEEPYKGFNQFLGGVSGINPNLNEKNSKFAKLLQLDSILDGSLADAVNVSLSKAIGKGAGSLKANPKSYSANEIKKLILAEGGSGAFGAMRGAIFEAIIQSITGGVSQGNEGKLDVVFDSNRAVLEEIFGVENKQFEFGDFKNSLNSKGKYARQIITNVPKAASGYIPNFADPLQDAVDRERSAGLPISQIRINQSGKLRNAQNPMGLAVTNTRDEPTGAIPNYARGNDELGSAADRLTTKFFALQGVMSVFGTAVGETGGALGEFTQAAMTSAQILLALQAFGMTPGIKLGSKFGAGKRGVAVKRSIEGFSAGRGGTVSKLFSKLGPVANLFGKMGPFLGKVVGGLGRFVPILGTVLTLFPLINAGFKKLFGEGIFAKVGKFLGLIETPAEKASKALGELADQTAKNLAVGSTPFRNFQFELEKKLEKESGTSGITGDENQREFLLKKAAQGFLDLNVLEGEGRQKKTFKKQGRRNTLVADQTFLRGTSDFRVTGIEDSKIQEEANKVRVNLLGAILAGLDEKEFEDLFKTGSAEDIRKRAEKEFKSFDKKIQKQILDRAVDIIGSTFEGGEKAQLLPTKVLADIIQQTRIQKQASKDVAADMAQQTRQPVFDQAFLNNLKAEKQLREIINTNEKKFFEENKKFHTQILDLSKKTTSSREERVKQEGLINKKLEQQQKRQSDSQAAIKNFNKNLRDLAKDKIFKGGEEQFVKGILSQISKFNLATDEGLSKIEELENNLESPLAAVFIRELTGDTENFQQKIEALLPAIKTLKQDLTFSKTEGETFFDQAVESINRIFNLSRVTRGRQAREKFGEFLSSEGLSAGRAAEDARVSALTPNQTAINRRLNVLSQPVLNQSEMGGIRVAAESSDLQRQNEIIELEKERIRLQTQQKRIVEDFFIQKKGIQDLDATEIEKQVQKLDINKFLNKLSEEERNIIADKQMQSKIDLSQLEERLRLTQDTVSSEEKILEEIKKRGPLGYGFATGFAQNVTDAETNAVNLGKALGDASANFAYNIGNAMLDAIEKGENLGDVLLGTAAEFLSTMSRAFMRSAVNDVLGSFGIGNFQGGGPIRGGSGTKDDVPAMLMGGEFVMNKKAVRKYGVGFMSALNSGSLQGFRSGGQVRDREGMFTTPGMNGAGSIVGARNLLSFATQTPIAMRRDTITSSGAFLDPESGRLSMFGRRNSPQFQKVQSAKQQAFDLYASELAAREQARRQKEESRKQLMNSLVSAAASVVVGAGLKSMSAGFKAGFQGTDGSFGTKLGAGLRGSIFGGNEFGGKTYGGLANLFTNRRFSSGIRQAVPVAASDLRQSSPRTPQYLDALGDDALAGLTLEERGVGTGSSSIPQSTSNQSSGPTYVPFQNGRYMENWADFTPAQLRKVGADSYATGGLIPAAGGVDTVPAMLSGGEFVMNAAATRNIGAGNLQALNSGAGVGDNADLVSKLDELIIATETSQSTGEINITINGSTGTEAETQTQNTTDQQKALSDKIKTAVKQVIADEKRLGGQLRR